MRGILKPAYIFSPRNVFRRLGFRRALAANPRQVVTLPWSTNIEVELLDAIGREIYCKRTFDLAVSECAWRLIERGNVIVDAGANIGYMTNLFAIRAGTEGAVHAFEPHPGIRRTLAANVARVHETGTAASIIVHECALGRTEQEAELVESAYFASNHGTASLRVGVDESVGDEIAHRVRVAPLDSFFHDNRIDLLKIDVEGHEAAVVQGAHELLRTNRIRQIIYEDHDLGRGKLPGMFQRYGYSVYSIGETFWGPTLRTLDQTIALDISWQSASFLATLERPVPDIMRRKGWHVLRGY